LEINAGSGFQVVAQTTNAESISYRYTVTTSAALELRVTAVLAESTVSSTKNLNVILRQPNTIAALPNGVKNGINYDPHDPTKATLVLLAPGKQFVYAVGDFNGWNLAENSQMNQTPDGEYFWISVTNLIPQKEYVFQYWVDGTIKIGDPYADKVADPYNDKNIPADVYPNLISYTNTQNGIATVLQTGQEAFQWTHPTVAGGQPAKEDLVIYELLLRDFLASHNYRDLTDTLSYLKRLGVNAIELLPIMEFEGNESWGYNPSYLFAPDKYYGTKNDLKAFINEAHKQGFVVLLDMVLNHQFGQSPMVRMYFDNANGKPSAQSPWFNPDATHPFNVGYDFNHESPYTKRYVDDVNRYWLEEYHFDGFRFDLSKGFTQVNNPNDVGAWSAYDQSRINILTRMTDVIWQTDADAYVIFEHLADNSEEKVLADYGIMLWGNMNHPYNNVVNGQTNTDLNWALSGTRNWTQKNLVPYMESHDEERLMVRALSEGLSNGDYNIRNENTALDRVKLASAFFYPLPGPKMLWQFGELGYDISINFNGRVGNKPIPWGEQDGLNYHQDPERIKLYKATAAIINLVNEYSDIFENGNFSWTPNGQFRRISVSHADMNVVIIGNFGVTAGSMSGDFQHAGTWYDFFSGRPYNFTSTSQAITLEPGQFHIFVDEVVSFPEPGLVYTPVYISAPTDLTAEIYESAVRLLWNDNSDRETGYSLQRKAEDESSFTTIATLAGDIVEHTDVDVLDGVTYSYRVQTISDVQPSSDWSNTAVADLILNAPTALSADYLSKKTIVLTWTDNSQHEAAYTVERSVGNGNHQSAFTAVAEVAAGATMFTDSNVSPGKTYTYRVLARDNDEVSTASNEAALRPADHKKITLITLYPNAASNALTVGSTHEGAVQVRISTPQGVVVKSVEVASNNQVKVDVSDWPEGLYIVHAQSQNESARLQLVVKH
jgi:glycosidase